MPRLPVAERRAQLADAAIAVMTREGVRRATTRAICAEAGVSLSVFHYCFDSKQQLLEAVIDRITKGATTPARTTIEPGPTLRDTLRAAFAAYWDHVRANPDQHLLLAEVTTYALRTPGLEEVARNQYAAYQQAYVDVLEVLLELPGVEPSWPARTLAAYLTAQVEGATVQWLATRDDQVVEDVTDRLADHVAAILGEPVTGA